jgi:hypothetical protein
MFGVGAHRVQHGSLVHTTPHRHVFDHFFMINGLPMTSPILNWPETLASIELIAVSLPSEHG